MRNFVEKGSIVRKIWGNADTILFIFAGASAEFALNKAVDWLYFTGKLPSDPIARLFSTVTYARRIVFSSHDNAVGAIDQITAIHKNVEASRGARIPDWAYRDVLYMLIDYSIRAFEVLERPLTQQEREEIFTVFNEVGERMGIKNLPASYPKWVKDRQKHLESNLAYSNLTKDLYKQYRRQLGPLRFAILEQIQYQITPETVKLLLPEVTLKFLNPLLMVYKLFRFWRIETLVKSVVLPRQYHEQVIALNAR